MKNNQIMKIATVLLMLLLIAIVLFSTLGKVHGKLLDFAENQWTGYSELRQEPIQPDCATDAATSATGDTEANADAGNAGSDADVMADDEDSLLDDLFGEAEDEVSTEAIQAAALVCQQKLVAYERIVDARKSSGLLTFIGIEQVVGKIVTESVGFGRQFLVIIFLLCGLVTTLGRFHLGMRNPQTTRGDRMSQAAQLGGNLFVMISFLAFYRQDLASGVEHVSDLPLYWMAAFGCMAASNLWLLLKPLKGEEKSTLGQDFLGIPLYAYMAWISGLYFVLAEQHPAGVAIYLSQMTEHANLYTNIALYVFSGMMLKYTSIADKFLAILRPWKLSPELLVFVVVLASAIPTAYSGASGIFVIAAGAIIYRELKLSKTRESLALAGTAMSGSMGIVLSPCLIIVVIAALNKEVTTTQLFHAGLSVFAVNILIMAVVLFSTKHERLSCENPIIAIPKMGRAILPVLPYIGIGAAVILVLNFGLGAKFDEYSAPFLLPFVLIVLLVFDRIMDKRGWKKDQLPNDTEAAKGAEIVEKTPATPPAGIASSLLQSAQSTSIHSGGLLGLMTLSICIGGIIDRANLNTLLPQEFSSPFLAMALLFVILVIIGMIMDPYGAVILVSATLTHIAYANGISPLHFWITVLCAFELGYLSPPVALNHLLTRQIVGEAAYAGESGPNRPTKFWDRHERILLPIAIKGTVLLLVAFIPLILLKF